MKIYRLSNDEMRRWRANEMCLVRPDGSLYRYATKEEKASYYEGLKTRVSVGVREGDVVYEFRTDREVMAEELLAIHGRTQLRSPAGRVMKCIKPAGEVRVSVEESQRIAPAPSNCNCAKWHGRVEGRHHRICRFNEFAPPEERGDIDFPEAIEDGKLVMAKVEEETASPKPVELPKPAEDAKVEVLGPATQVVTQPRVEISASAGPLPPVAGIPSPQECVCRNWQKPEGADPDMHHPICEWFETWNQQGSSRYLYTPDGDRWRVATHIECLEAERNIEENGVPSIKFGEKTFYLK